MDMENIANVNANYSASESHKVNSAPAETVHTAATTVSELSLIHISEPTRRV